MTSPVILSTDEDEQLIEIFRATDDRGLRDRVQAVLMASRARPTAEIATDLAVHPSTVWRWLALWRSGGLAALPIHWGPGKRPLIDEERAALSRRLRSAQSG